jgi:hypothetical protein
MPDSVSVIISEEGTGATIHRALRSQFVGDEPSEVIPPVCSLEFLLVKVENYLTE